MALAHWWPLNGDTKDYGLSPINITNNGATSDTTGKIGSCYVFDGTDDYMATTEDIYFDPNNKLSIALWIYPTASDVSILGSNNYQFQLRIDGSKHLFFNQWTSSGTNSLYTTSSAITLNAWTHVVLAWDGRNMKLYINGSLDKTFTYAAGNTHKSGNLMNIGGNIYAANTGGSRYFTGKLNDIRIYDHALTTKEVKELSKCLILHYDFEDGDIEPTTNIFPAAYQNAKFITGASGNTFNASGSFSVSATQHGTYTLSGYYKLASTDTATNPRVTLCAKYSEDTNQTQIGRFPVSTNQVKDNQWHYFSITGTTNSSKTLTNLGGWIFDYSSAGNARNIECKEVQLEYKDHATPYTSGTRQMRMVYDVSGYNYTGIPTGAPAIVKTSDIGEHSCYFDGGSTAVQTPDLSSLIHDGNFTLIGWFMHTDEWGSDGYETLYGGPSGFEIEAKHSGTNSPAFSPHNWGGSTNTDGLYRYAYSLNEWHQWAMVRTSSSALFYIDGILRITGSSAGSIPSGSYFIGAWKTYAQQNYKGYIGDFKIYATALTADDILKDYQSVANIDKDYNLTAYKFIENSSRSDYALLEETGVFNTKEINEFNVPGYTRLEYIRSTGTQYIDTEFIPSINTTRCLAEFMPLTTADTAFFGARNGSNPFYFFYNVGNNYTWPCSQATKVSGTPALAINNKYIVDWNKGDFKFYNENGVLLEQATRSGSARCATSMYIFNFQPTDGRSTNARLYSFKIWDNDKLVRDFVPVENSSGVYGLYDQVTGKFFPNKGTGQFQAKYSDEDEYIPISNFKTYDDGRLSSCSFSEGGVNGIDNKKKSITEFIPKLKLASNNDIIIENWDELDDKFKDNSVTFGFDVKRISDTYDAYGYFGRVINNPNINSWYPNPSSNTIFISSLVPSHNIMISTNGYNSSDLSYIHDLKKADYYSEYEEITKPMNKTFKFFNDEYFDKVNGKISSGFIDEWWNSRVSSCECSSLKPNKTWWVYRYVRFYLVYKPNKTNIDISMDSAPGLIFYQTPYAKNGLVIEYAIYNTASESIRQRRNTNSEVDSIYMEADVNENYF